MHAALKKLSALLRIGVVNDYTPKALYKPPRLIDVETGWRGHELVVRDILDRFHIRRDSCLEFGVEFGYSSVVFSNFFKRVVGVDTFEGDIHSFRKNNHFEETRHDLNVFQNIELYQSDYKDWIRNDDNQYDLIHVDIVHTYSDTYRCGLWSAMHSTCTLFHDTESFPEVKLAVAEIARATRKKFFNYKPHYGLGIVI
jgi:hypothetical protein